MTTWIEGTAKRSEGTVERPGGVVLAYEDSGEPEAGGDPTHTIVLTHGFTLTLRSWDPTVAALVADGWRVVTWDVRGHGRSTAPLDPALYTLDHVVEDLVALLDHLGLERVVLGGLSFGGFLALATWVAAPQRIRALVLADTGPGFRNPEAREAWNRTAEDRAAAIEAGGEAAVLDGGASGGPEVAGQLGLDRHASYASLGLAVRGFLTQQDARAMEALPSVEVPTLVLVGSEDEPFLRASDVMAARIPDATLVVITGAGHLANLDEPEAFQSALLAFLSRL